MNAGKNISVLFLIGFVFFSCSRNDRDPVSTKYPAKVKYVIKNKSDFNLRVAFTAKGAKNDSMRTVSKHNSERIYIDCRYDNFPTPSTSFSKITFYKKENKTTPALVISPIKNSQWNLIGQELAVTGPDPMIYSLVISNNDLK